MDWNNTRTGKTIRKANVLLDLANGKEDKNVWNKFILYTDADAATDYVVEFCSIICDAKTPLRETLFTDFLPSLVSSRKQEFDRFLVTAYLNHNEQEKAYAAITSYKEEYGETKEILVEELEYCNMFDSKNTAKLEELIASIQSFETV